jgi:hypothetical protein
MNPTENRGWTQVLKSGEGGVARAQKRRNLQNDHEQAAETSAALSTGIY